MMELRYRLNGERVDFLTDALRGAGLPVKEVKSRIYNITYGYEIYVELKKLEGETFLQFEEENGKTNPRCMGRMLITESTLKKVIKLEKERHRFSPSDLLKWSNALGKALMKLNDMEKRLCDEEALSYLPDAIEKVTMLRDRVDALYFRDTLKRRPAAK